MRLFWQFKLRDKVCEKRADLLSIEITLAEHFHDATLFRFTGNFLKKRTSKRDHHFPVKLLASVLPQVHHYIFKGSATPVRSIGSHGIKRIGQRRELCSSGDLYVC